MIIPTPYVHCGIGLLIALTSIPLILRKIPMNRFYGIRIQKAFASQQNWYEINAYGGKLLFVFGLLLFAFGWLSMDFAPPPTSAWAPVFLSAPLLLMIPFWAAIRSFVRSLPER